MGSICMGRGLDLLFGTYGGNDGPAEYCADENE